MAPVYKLNYFNLRARGECVRWILHAAGQDFTDNRFEFAEWPAFKATTPFGQVPYLEVDGKPLAQSRAIGRFLARQHGFAGANAWDEAIVDSIIDLVEDASKGYYAWAGALLRLKDEAKAEILKGEFLTTGVVPFLASFERQLQSNDSGKGFLVGLKPTWADFTVVIFLDEVVRLGPHALDKYPLLKALCERIHNLKGIKEWMAARPQTPV